jgi:hypothetical protein
VDAGVSVSASKGTAVVVSASVLADSLPSLPDPPPAQPASVPMVAATPA